MKAVVRILKSVYEWVPNLDHTRIGIEKIRLFVSRLIFHANYTLTKYANVVSDYRTNNATLQKVKNLEHA